MYIYLQIINAPLDRLARIHISALLFVGQVSQLSFKRPQEAANGTFNIIKVSTKLHICDFLLYLGFECVVPVIGKGFEVLADHQLGLAYGGLDFWLDSLPVIDTPTWT